MVDEGVGDGHCFVLLDHHGALRPRTVRARTFEDAARELIEASDRGYNVYFTLAGVLPGQTRKATNMIAPRVVCADFDRKDGHVVPSRYPLAPTAVLESGHGTHTYWKLEGDCTFEQFTAIQKGIAATLNSDPRISDPARIMRVPLLNHKTQPPRACRVTEVHAERRYRVDELEQAFCGLRVSRDARNRHGQPFFDRRRPRRTRRHLRRTAAGVVRPSTSPQGQDPGKRLLEGVLPRARLRPLRTRVF